MALHRPPCYDANQHILAVRDTPEYAELDLQTLIRLAVAEYERETAPEPFDPIDAYKRMRDLGWSEGEMAEAWGR